MDFRVRLLFLAGVGSVFFLVGYLYGEMGSAGPSSSELQSVLLQLHQAARGALRDPFLKPAELERLQREVMGAEAWAAAAPLTGESLRRRQEGARALGRASGGVLEAARLGLADARYARARALLEAVRGATELARGRLEALLPAAAGTEPAAAAGGAPAGAAGELAVRVAERPFGAHVRRGSTEVSEVFPGFPAHRSGVRAGCEILRIAGRPVDAGTWMEAFQKAQLPFEIRLRCRPPGGKGKGKGAGRGPVDQDPHRFRVMVVKKPFGMNIQVHVAPRVVEVLPGFPAEAAGVREGFVLKEIGDVPVDAVTWFEAFQNMPLPFTLTFDTTVPLHPGNPFFARNDSKHFVYLEKRLPPLPDTQYTDFHCEVSALPFGMQIRAPLDGRPRVARVLPGRPAEGQGVHEGDVLVELAGRPVNSSTWFAAFQQAAPPFGLRFRRPFAM